MRALLAVSLALVLAGCDAVLPPPPPHVVVTSITILGAPAESPDRKPWDGGFQNPAPDVYASVGVSVTGTLFGRGNARTQTFPNVDPTAYPLLDPAFYSVELGDATQTFLVEVVDSDDNAFSNDDVMWRSEPFRFVDLPAGGAHTFSDVDGRPRVRLTFQLRPGR